MIRSVSIVGLESRLGNRSSPIPKHKLFCAASLPSKNYRSRDRADSFLRTGPRSGNHSTTSKTSKERGAQVGAWLATGMEGQQIVYTEWVFRLQRKGPELMGALLRNSALARLSARKRS
jgi:hypothetical protein